MGAGAADWLRKENHHLLEENARLRVNLSALSKAAGGECSANYFQDDGRPHVYAAVV
eukprot:COSAG06_NODE_49134_length_327_cov_0.973684_1_plen_56_part_01